MWFFFVFFFFKLSQYFKTTLAQIRWCSPVFLPVLRLLLHMLVKRLIFGCCSSFSDFYETSIWREGWVQEENLNARNFDVMSWIWMKKQQQSKCAHKYRGKSWGRTLQDMETINHVPDLRITLETKAIIWSLFILELPYRRPVHPFPEAKDLQICLSGCWPPEPAAGLFFSKHHICSLGDYKYHQVSDLI